MKRQDKALYWYDRAVGYEPPEGPLFAELRKAAYLLEIGHLKESLKIFERVLRSGFPVFAATRS